MVFFDCNAQIWLHLLHPSSWGSMEECNRVGAQRDLQVCAALAPDDKLRVASHLGIGFPRACGGERTNLGYQLVGIWNQLRKQAFGSICEGISGKN